MKAHNRFTPHEQTLVHQNAQRFIERLMVEDGATDVRSSDIADELGLTIGALNDARVHTLTCNLLGGYVIAYRAKKKGNYVTLFEPNAATVATALAERTNPAFEGWFRLQEEARVVRRRMVSIIESAAYEAMSSGQKDLAKALTFAAGDIDKYGELQAATLAYLQTVGAIQ